MVSEQQRDKLDHLASVLGVDRNAVVGRLIALDTGDLALDADATYEALSA